MEGEIDVKAKSKWFQEIFKEVSDDIIKVKEMERIPKSELEIYKHELFKRLHRTKVYEKFFICCYFIFIESEQETCEPKDIAKSIGLTSHQVSYFKRIQDFMVRGGLLKAENSLIKGKVYKTTLSLGNKKLFVTLLNEFADER